MTVLITEFFNPEGVSALSERYDVIYNSELAEDRAQLLRLVADSEALIVRNRTRVDDALLDSAPELRIVARMGVGLDNIDVEACRRREIEVVTGAGLNAIPVAEYVLSAILWLTRGLSGATTQVTAGEWPRQAYIGHEVHGRQLGLLGFGAIAREVASRALALGMRVVAHDPYVSADSSWGLVDSVGFDSLLEMSDVVSIHVPKTSETVGLISETAIQKMKNGAILINTSRGGLVDEQAAADAIRSQRLGGAALDVFDEEPLTAHGGLGFQSIPNLLLTPHIAGVTTESESRIAQTLVTSINQALGSKP